jgi:ribonucleoside-diphosphate reductase alpha chain
MIANEILSDITVYMKYARYLEKENRRETWSEICMRNMRMHIKKYPQLSEQIQDVYASYVEPKKILPSMRSMQFGGKPIEISPNRIYNCAYLPIDSYESFHESMFLLLGGTGVGYSVQQHHVNQLPDIQKPNPTNRRRHLVGDSIEGWADALKVLMKSYFGINKTTPWFDYSDIRPQGTPLKT